ncbi:hypothetical protein AXG93_1129s1220 [Marchantia polymorpha subsp. ruderalis]|uniref:Transducin/WD40 repeat-like superfamily protein n=1 Tax=Marchantia polymorpha subsp. ruderalis TaxID=1480154 RepID=A0A176W2B7_MARPO|nr:hypothetical protein AXG93_1129s1220 [Marchantia polymorpha subsp. ruderalis]
MFGVRERGGGGVLLRDRGGDVDFVELYADGGGRRAVISARERKEREELRNRHQVYQYEDETGRIVDGMEWITTQHLDLSPGRAGAPSVQPHCAAFHHSQALFAAAVGRHIIEFDALTGCKLSSIDIGAPVVRMAYSPAGGHIIVAVLEDWTIRSWDLETEHTYVLYSPGDKKSSKVPGGSVEVHIALTPLRPWLFFGAHLRMSVNVVGTIEGVRAATKIKADLKKPITDLACHPRSPLLYVAYADGLVRAYNIHNFSVQYTLQADNSIKLIGAGAFAFHSLLEWVFVGDRSGTLLAWDVSVPNRPSMIGITQVGSNPVAAIAWHSMLQLLLTLSKEGSVQVWKPRVILNPNRPHLRANFFEPAGLETLDVGNVLTQFGGVPVYPVPRIVDLLVHPKLNLATILFASMASGEEETRKRQLTVSKEARRQLFTVLQSARGSPVSVLKDKLSALGSSGIMHGHQLLHQARAQAGGTQLTMSDLARKAFLYGNSANEQVRSGPIMTLPLLTIADYSHLLRDVPVCQPLQQELKFFNSEQRIFNYPVRVFFMDACNLTSYNLTNGDYNIYKKLSTTAIGGNERMPKHMIYSRKHHLFMIFFECRGAPSEVVLYRDPMGTHSAAERVNTVAGRDGAFIGHQENQYAVLEDDGMGLVLNFLEEEPDLMTGGSARPSFSVEGNGKENGLKKPNGVPVADAITFEKSDSDTEGEEEEAEQPPVSKPEGPKQRVALQFVFDSTVQRIFSSPLEATLLYVLADSHLGLAKVSADAYAADGGHLMLSTKPEAGKFLKLMPLERVLQIRWQETSTGQAAGIMTTQRVMITSLVWVGPALLFSTATSVVILGWDGVARPLATIGTPNASLIGALNDRLLLACTNDPNPRNRQMVEVKTRLLGLLEPLMIGWTTLQKCFEPKLDLTEIMYQLTSRFDNLRVTPRSLDVLSRGPPVCSDLAVELAQAGPQFTQELRCKYAIQARRFDTALAILKDEYLRSRDYPRCPPTTRLFQRFRELGRACIRCGQFDRAKETFEVVSDYQSLLDLFCCHLNPSAMRRLAQKLEENKVDSELTRHVAKILTVRSVGWGQGGAFANLSAESMAPKGLEWGGGNWQIKTTPAIKIVPEWELSGEVTAYMKTPNGAIPTIIPEHIGVYLGTLKGRGTVVEIRENLHVRKFSSGVLEENGGAGDLPAGLARSASNKSKLSEDDGTKPGSGRATASGAQKGESESDAQARAEEEFKRGLYGLEKSSSDEEEGTVNTKKRFSIRIREKQAAASAVDVNKLKEATKQFRLGDSMHGVRTQRQSAGSGDMTATAMPTFTANPAPDMLALPAPPMGMGAPPMPGAPLMGMGVPSGPMMGVGVGTGPIPEDIFQGDSTVATFQATPYPPGVAFPGQQQPGSAPLQWTFQGLGTPQQGAPRFPDGGVPPQGGPPQPGSYELASGIPPQAVPGLGSELSLPDGGIPPQAGVTPPSAETSKGQPPTDLSALAGPAKPQSTLPKGPLKLGQVPRGAPASDCFKAGLSHIEQNQLTDAMSCFNEAFLALAKDQSLNIDVKPQAKICAQYKIAVLLLQEIARLQRVEGQGAVGAKEEMARLSRHLSTLPLQPKHRISCIRTAIKRNMDVQNYIFSKKMLDLLISKAPPNKQEELKGLVAVCVQRGLTDRTIDGEEDASQFCAATMGRLSTIGHDMCDTCSARFSALTSPGCTVCGMGTVVRSDAATGPTSSPFS